jgi:hypothetical protein
VKRWKLLVALAVVVGAIVVPPVVVRTVYPEAAPPAGLSAPTSAFGRVLVSQLERPPGTDARFVGFESRERDRLVILLFELRAYPYVLAPEVAFVASRCVDRGELEPGGMSGGIVVDGDPATDPELEFLRSRAQPGCP